jgi:chromosome segregation ATPase
LAEINQHIKQVHAKLQLLLAQHSKLLHENEQQKKHIEILQQADAQQKEKLEALRQEQLILKASLDKMDELEKKELEQKINGYLKNIDKCISLLSYKSNV